MRSWIRTGVLVAAGLVLLSPVTNADDTVVVLGSSASVEMAGTAADASGAITLINLGSAELTATVQAPTCQLAQGVALPPARSTRVPLQAKGCGLGSIAMPATVSFVGSAQRFTVDLVLAPVDALLSVGSSDPHLLIQDGDNNRVTVQVTNGTDDTSDLRVTAGPGLSTCGLDWSPKELHPKIATSVTIDLKACTVPKGGGVVTLNAGEAGTAEVLVGVQEGTTLTPWRVGGPFLAGVGAAVLVVGITFRSRIRNDLAAPVRLGTGWSFKDNWLANATTFVTAFVGLFGSTDLLKALLGSEPKGPVLTILVGGLVALALFAVAPPLLKLWGDAVSPTVGAVLAAGTLTVGAALGQIANVTLAVASTNTPEDWRIMTTIVAVLAAGLTVAYAVRSLTFKIDEGLKGTVDVLGSENILAVTMLMSSGTSESEALRIVRELLATPLAGPTTEGVSNGPLAPRRTMARDVVIPSAYI